MPVTKMTLDELNERLEALSQLAPREICIGVGDHESARYARVLEFGSIAGQAPWPRPGARTTLAVDPQTGAQVVVSAQAPQGFIRVQAPAMRDALVAELAHPANWLEAVAVDTLLSDALRAAAVHALERLRGSVPRDSGRLAASLTIVEDTSHH